MSLHSDWDWARDALCLEHPEVEFFPDKSDGAAVKRAKRICKECLVRSECLDYAYVNNLQGIWGGLFEDERRRVGALRKVVTIRESSVSVQTNGTVHSQVSVFQLRL